MGIFKAYDIRGTYPDQIDENTARRVGLAAAQVLGTDGPIVVGRDARTHAPSMQEALTEGLTAAGADVIDIGMCVTPLSYFACVHFEAAGAVQVTASHNPAAYSGFKITARDAKPVSYETGIDRIEALVTAGDRPPAAAPGRVRAEDLWPTYKAWLLKFAEELEPMKIVVDTGNGVAGARIQDLFDALPGELVGLYLEPDGTFPHHQANPLRAENMRDLQAAVRREGADLGAAFDGDGDRVMFVDERGALVRSDLVTALIGVHFLAREPGAKIAYDLRSSRVVPEEIRNAGGVPIETRVGHSFIKAILREEGAVFAGELSGHFYFRDAHYTDNGEVALLILLSIVSASDRSLGELIAPLQRLHGTGEINFEVADKDASLAAIKEAFADGRLSELDGVTVQYDDWWFNLRPSNTEPLLRLNLEARTPEQMERSFARVKDVLGAEPVDH